ncbi:nSTAND1 domain-containing NTPase [Nonomuraea wenchangensis]|uniref:nSTAND1 domain-containing NTPase n=1 Tax=Nonomuraea wenchangensis TaxID=568860 RepID=UPI00340BDEFC
MTADENADGSGAMLYTAVAQILNAHGDVVGTGFLIEEGVVVTCSHVVALAGSGPGRTLSAAFPHVAGSPRLDGHVVTEAWRDPNGADIAVVRLESTPTGARVLAMGMAADCGGHRVRSYGFPQQAPQSGHFGYGVAGHLLPPAPASARAGSLLQLTDANDLTTGFSGAPVLDEMTGLVIGMVSAITAPDAYNRGQGIVYATPTEMLRTVWPGLNTQDVSPYRGLEPFTVEHVRWFHGRDTAVERVLAALARHRRALLLLGPSGAGKSSLIQAGVLPRLAAGGLPGSDRWLPLLARPGQDPLEELERAGLPGVGGDGIVAAVERRLAAESDRQRVLLVIDQFEELLAQPSATERLPDGHLAAIEQITEAISSQVPLSVILILRDDFYPRLAALAPELLEATTPGLLNMPTTLSIQDLHAIITRPAQDAGARFKEGLPERIIDDVLAADHDGATARQATVTVLPLLELMLSQLWKDRQDGYLTHEVYQHMGGVTGSLATWGDNAIRWLSAEQRPVARRILTALVRPADDPHHIPAVRQQVPLAKLRELASDTGTPPAAGPAVDDQVINTVIKTLTHQRIMTTHNARAGERSDDAVGDPVAELIHDALIREWGTLRDWVRQDHRFHDWLRRATEQHARWDTHRNPDDLLHGTDLAEGLSWEGKYRLPRDIATFVTASHQRQRSAARRARRLNVILAGVLLIAVAAAGLATSGQNEARRQQRAAQDSHRLAVAHALVNQADDVSERDPRTAVRLSLAAESIHQDARTAASLFHAVTAHEIGATLIGHDTDVQAVAPRQRRGLVASADDGGRVIFWDVSRPQGPLRLGGIDTGQGKHPKNGVRAVAWSPDGLHLATAGADGTIGIWDVTEPAAVRQLGDFMIVGTAEEVFAAAWSPHGDRLATGSADGLVTVWDVSTPSRPRRVASSSTGEAVFTVDWSPDGATLASAGADAKVSLWDVPRTGLRRIGAPLTHSRVLHTIAWSPDGKALVTAAGWPNHQFFVRDEDPEAVVMWDMTDLSHPRRTGAPLKVSDVTGVAWAPDGEQLAISIGVALYVVSADDLTRGRLLSGHTDEILALAWYDERTLISSGHDRTVMLWDVERANQARQIPRPLTSGGRDVRAVTWSPDGDVVAVASSATIAFWDMSRPDQPRQLGRPLPWPTGGRSSGGIQTMAWSRDGRFLAVGSGGNDGAVLLWDVSNLELPRRLGEAMTFSEAVTEVAWSPQPGRNILAVGLSGTVSLVSLDDPAAPRRLGETSLSEMAVERFLWSPDGTRLAIADAYEIYLWDVTDLRLPRLIGDKFNTRSKIITYSGEIYPISWASDGKTLASIGYDNRAQFWDLTVPTTPTRAGDGLGDPEDSLRSVTWSPTGEILATVAADHSVSLWDVTDLGTPRRIGRALSAPKTELTGATAWSPSGQFLVTATEGNEAIIWDLRSVSLLRAHRAQRACVISGGGLTPEQWRQFIPTLAYKETCERQTDAAPEGGGDSPRLAAPPLIWLGSLLAILIVGAAWIFRRRVRSSRRRSARTG